MRLATPNPAAIKYLPQVNQQWLQAQYQLQVES